MSSRAFLSSLSSRMVLGSPGSTRYLRCSHFRAWRISWGSGRSEGRECASCSVGVCVGGFEPDGGSQAYKTPGPPHLVHAFDGVRVGNDNSLLTHIAKIQHFNPRKVPDVFVDIDFFPQRGRAEPAGSRLGSLRENGPDVPDKIDFLFNMKGEPGTAGEKNRGGAFPFPRLGNLCYEGQPTARLPRSPCVPV